MVCRMFGHYLNQWLLIINGHLGTNYGEIWIKIQQFSLKKYIGKCRLQTATICLGLYALILGDLASTATNERTDSNAGFGKKSVF